MKTVYTHIVRRKITGYPISRHKSKDAACANAVRRGTPADPLEVIYYSDIYWKEMR